MSAKSILHCKGNGSITCNNRDFTPTNVDPARSKDNVTYVRQPLADAYEHCFADSVKRFNDRQTRTDRQIHASYYEYLFGKVPMSDVSTSDNKQKSFYESLVQVGSMDDTTVDTPDGELTAKCLDEYMQGFAERNPNLHVFNAVLHMDETTPHLHINYIPVGHYTRGLDTQNGIAQALKEMGHGTGKHSVYRWRHSERQVLEDICRKYSIEITNSNEYKAHKDLEIAELQARVDELEALRLETMSGVSKLRLEALVLQGKVSYLERRKKRAEDKLEAIKSKIKQHSK